MIGSLFASFWKMGSDAIFLREMIGFAAERLMQLETDGLCVVGHGERSVAGRNQRNGNRDRNWETRDGTVELHILNRPGFAGGYFV